MSLKKPTGSAESFRTQSRSSSSSDGSPLEIEEEVIFDINLRSSCLDCAFLANCPVAEKRGTPKLDVLIGTYRITALKKRCLV